MSLTIAVLADSDTLKMGQTVISLGGKLRNSVSIGVITSFVELNNSSSESSTPEIVALGEQGIIDHHIFIFRECASDSSGRGRSGNERKCNSRERVKGELGRGGERS